MLHAHGDAIDAAVVGWLGRLLRLPSVVSMHGGLSRSRVYRMMAGLAFSAPSRVLAVSADIRAELIGLGVRPERVTVRSSGFDPEQFRGLLPERAASLQAELPGGLVPVVIAVGRLHPVKGFDVLIEAATTLKALGVVHQILIVGEGPEEEKLKKKAFAGSTVHFLGRRPKNEIAEWLQLASLFVLPSIVLPGQKEGTPTALLEAMAAALPCVITTAVAVDDLIRHGENGWTVPANDSGALSEALAYLLGQPQLMAALGTRARESVAGYDWTIVAAEVLSVYEELVGGPQ